MGGTLYLNLWQRGKNSNKRGAVTAGRGLIPGCIDIEHRHVIVDAKSRLGDWELDSIIDAKHRGAITSMAKRKSKLTILVLLDGPTSEKKRHLNSGNTFKVQCEAALGE